MFINIISIIIFGFHTLHAVAQERCSSSAYSCSYYSCREEVQNCGVNGYFVHFALPYCEKYLAEQKNFSPRGKVFLKKVRLCLQQELNNQADFSLECSETRSIAISTHPECYEKSGFCELPGNDQKKVIEIAAKEILDPAISKAFLSILKKCWWRENVSSRVQENE